MSNLSPGPSRLPVVEFEKKEKQLSKSTALIGHAVIETRGKNKIYFCFYFSSGILYPWTGLGKMVCTGMYQYVPVQDGHGTGQYENSQFVHTSMYQYILVRTFKKSSGFLTNPESVRRDEIRVIHRLCMGYNVTRSNFKTAQLEV